eukprot:4870945-Pleurochrysis_carterae.AAC.2
MQTVPAIQQVATQPPTRPQQSRPALLRVPLCPRALDRTQVTRYETWAAIGCAIGVALGFAIGASRPLIRMPTKPIPHAASEYLRRLCSAVT